MLHNLKNVVPRRNVQIQWARHVVQFEAHNLKRLWSTGCVGMEAHNLCAQPERTTWKAAIREEPTLIQEEPSVSR